MASTYTASDAFTYIKVALRQMPVQDVQYTIINRAITQFWMADSWRWTIGTTPTITLVTDTQDYSLTYPGDYLYTHQAYFSDGDLRVPLIPAASLPTSNIIKGTPDMIARIPGANTCRVWPTPGTMSGTNLTVVQLYKKVVTLITAGNFTSVGALIFDDEWFTVFLDILLYHAFIYGFDSRAGTMEWDNDGKAKHTGQLAVAMSGIENMRRREPLTMALDRKPDPIRKKL